MAMTDEEYMLRAVELAKKGTGWKYDFLSVLLCIVLMVSAFGGACLMAAFDFALHRGSSYSVTVSIFNNVFSILPF